MIKIITIVGARPQIIKAAAISRIIHSEFRHLISEEILHTGQHFDKNMSDVFFEEMDIPKPHYQLSISAESQGEQTALMISGIEKILLKNKPELLIIYGDTNSSIAAALAASKLQIPIAHIEAGLRSYNKSMPEELNRIYCDYAATLLFCPTKIAIENLTKENLIHSENKTYSIDNKGIFLSGDIMYDNAIYYSKIAAQKSAIISNLCLEKNKFLLCTIHRAYNTDNNLRLKNIFEGINRISNDYQIAVIIPLHPRTKAVIGNDTEIQEIISSNENIRIIDAVSYFEMIELEKNSELILSDSGGVQKEAYFFGKACIILRSETEWKELSDNGYAIIADANPDLIYKAYQRFKQNKTITGFESFYGDGNAARLICNTIINNFNSRK